MFTYDDESDHLADLVSDFVRDRLRTPPPIVAPPTGPELRARLGQTVTKDGLGADAAMDVFRRVVAPAAIPLDSPRHCALIPGAPTITASLFDACVGAAALVAEAWIEASGAIEAENQALRWIADLAGLPAEAGGVFVSGGTNGNLSALCTARDANAHGRRKVAVGRDAHSSIAKSLHILGLDAAIAPADESGRLTHDALATVADDPDVFAVVTTAGNTNTGSIDDLDGVARIARERGWWMHVDAAYGGAAMCAPSVRHLFDGIERADSVIVDPHKWLFAPLDCCALLYRDPERAVAVHRQGASYLDTMRVEGEWDPTDYAIHLTRRARGLPFWFSLATHGTEAYGDAVEAVLANARAAAQIIRDHPDFELVVEPQLAVLLFRCRGDAEADYLEWSRRLLAAGTAFVLPTKWHGEPVGRFVFLHPHTTVDLFEECIAELVAHRRASS